MYLLERENKREHELGKRHMQGEEDGEGETDSPLSREPLAGAQSQDPGIMT